MVVQVEQPQTGSLAVLSTQWAISGLYGGKKEEVAGLQAAHLKTDGKLTLPG